MTIEGKKILKRFIRLVPTRFSAALGEDAREFLISCHERLHNLLLVESHGVNFITFQLNRPAK